MDTTTLANEIAGKVIADTSFWVAFVGFAGVIVGAIISVFGNFLLHRYQDNSRRKLDEGRKILLEKMLRDTRFKERCAKSQHCLAWLVQMMKQRSGY